MIFNWVRILIEQSFNRKEVIESENAKPAPFHLASLTSNRHHFRSATPDTPEQLNENCNSQIISTTCSRYDPAVYSSNPNNTFDNIKAARQVEPEIAPTRNFHRLRFFSSFFDNTD
jgi:hypothetical protein